MIATKKTKVLCVFGRILGGKTFSSLLDDFFSTKKEFECGHIDFSESDYNIKTANPLASISSGAEVAAKMAVKLRRTNIDPAAYDLLFFQSHRLCVPFAKYIRYMPTVVALDATPRSAHRGNVQAYSSAAILKAWMSRLYDAIWYRPIFQNVDFFLARTALVRQSLIDDYSVSAERIAVTYSPLQLVKSAQTKTHDKPDKPRLLFIGNDFERKGGPFLLELFEHHLKDECSLTIVSKDPSLGNRSWSKGVTFVPGIAHENIHNLYLESDIFVMPTWKDEMGIVICEAMAAGLPVVARDAGAQNELIEDNCNGFLMRYHSNTQEWATQLRKLINSEELRLRFGQVSRRKAGELFDKEIFFRKLDSALRHALDK